MRQQIIKRLKEIEREHNIKLLYACESGSRAWGFPSKNSDYDIRFIYSRPLEWYLSINEKKRDVIEYKIDANLDISGWDLKKTLQLLSKTNPPLLEWLNSPIIYYEEPIFTRILREYAKIFYHPTACLYHYYHMAKHNYDEYLQGDIVWVKKYFYVLRPLLAMKWIYTTSSMAPTDFNILVTKLNLDDKLKFAIDILLERKLNGDELLRDKKIAVLDSFIIKELNYWAETNLHISDYNIHKPIEELDRFFYGCVVHDIYS